MVIRVTFLGTSCQIPTAKRNHSAILLGFDGENMLIDCGEGTQRQFRKARLNPCRVTKVLITHLHGDHILGLPGFLSTLALSGYGRTLYIYGPKGTEELVRSLLKVFRFTKRYDIVVKDVSGKFFECDNFYLMAESMKHGIPCNAYSFVKKGGLRIDKKKLKKFKLPGGPMLKDLKAGKRSISYKGKKYLAKDLTFREGDKKVSFVLDTLNNRRIVPFVRGSDLLVCESSFCDGEVKKAKEHLHLTAKQAGEIAKKSGSKRLVLTHISQRYERKMGDVLKEVKREFAKSFIANDFDCFEVA